MLSSNATIIFGRSKRLVELYEHLADCGEIMFGLPSCLLFGISYPFNFVFDASWVR